MEEIIGYVAAACTTFSLVPQAWKAWRLRETSALSLYTYVIFVIGVSLWCLYGIMSDDMPVTLANAVSIGLGCIILICKLRYG